MTTSLDIMCIGDLDVDFYIAIPAMPGFDQKIAGRHLGQKPGGMSANFAVAVARMGKGVRLVAAVGDDAPGAQVLQQLAAEGVDLTFIARRKDATTFMCVVLLSPSGEKSLIKLESEAYLPRPDDLVPAAFDGIRHVHATYGSPSVTAKAFEIAGQRGQSTSLDLEPPDILNAPQHLAEVLARTDTLFLNREACKVASEALEKALYPGLLQPHGEIIITLGASGCRRISADGVLDVPGFHVRPVDTTGAGDCFAGAYLARKLEGASPPEALEFANAAAALATLDLGAQTAMPRRQAVETFLAEAGGYRHGQANRIGYLNA